jgi:hypothetical protein
MKKSSKRAVVILGALLVLGALGYFGFGYAAGRLLEARGLRKLIGGKTAKVLDCNAGYLPIASNGLRVWSRGFLAQASPPRALTEMRASGLYARSSLSDIWRGNWRVERVVAAHLQAAYGELAAKQINRNEFPPPELLPPLQEESPIDLDLRQIDIKSTDLFWGSKPEALGEFRDVHTVISPRDKNLVIEAEGGTFRMAKWPAAQVQRLALFFAKPNLRVDAASLTLGGDSVISVLGNFAFAQPETMDLQLTFSRCPLAPFLSEEQRSKFEGQIEGTSHLQKDGTSAESVRAAGGAALSKGVIKNVEALQRVAEFTSRPELAHLKIDRVAAEYDWNAPTLSVKKFTAESGQLFVLKGEFTVKDNKLDGEFEIGLAPDLVDKFPGAREEVFKRSADGYLWTEVNVSGPLGSLRNNLKPRLVRAAQNHFAKGLLAPIFKPGRTVIEALEDL